MLVFLFSLYFKSFQLNSQFTPKRLQYILSSILHIIESLATGSGSAQGNHTQMPPPQASLDITCMSKLLVGMRQQTNSQWQAKFPLQQHPRTAPPAEKCNHIFRKGGSRAHEKRVYQIHRHCHYAVHVVSLHICGHLYSASAVLRASRLGNTHTAVVTQGVR